MEAVAYDYSWLPRNNQISEPSLFDTSADFVPGLPNSPAMSDLDIDLDLKTPFTFNETILYPSPATPPSTSTSPFASSFSLPAYQHPYTHIPLAKISDLPTPLLTDVSSEELSPLSSPRFLKAEPQSPTLSSIKLKNHATSTRRRAQNRKAQRAFRERKEQHAKELERQLGELTEKYQRLEREHKELASAHEKLRGLVGEMSRRD